LQDRSNPKDATDLTMISSDYRLTAITIHRVAQLVQQRIDAELQDSRLTRLSWLATAHMAEDPGLTIGDLAVRLQLGSATTGQLVDRLVRDGWAQRTPSAADRRALVVHPTEKAEQVLKELEPRQRPLHDDILRDLTADERTILLDLLERIRKRLSSARATG
jgi:DNA-binding MarR family transcriptional regulator